MSLFDQQWVEGRIPFQFITQTSGSGGSGELPGTGDLLPDTNTRVIGDTDHRWQKLVVKDIQASDTITSNSIQTATATVGGIMSAGQTSVSELTILQSNDAGSLLTGAGTGTFRIRRGANELDSTAISLTDHSIDLIRVNGDAGLSLNTLNGTTSAAGAFQANFISSASDINALGGTITGQILQGNANIATPLAYVTSIQPIDTANATIGSSSNRWKSFWGQVVNTTSLVTSTIQAASQTISGAVTMASLAVSGAITVGGGLNVTGVATAHEVISGTGVTANSVQANSVFSSPLSYMDQIIPISYNASTLGTSSNNWKEIWASTITGSSIFATLLRAASLIVSGTSTLYSALVQTNLVVIGSTTAASLTTSGAINGATVTASGNMNSGNTITAPNLHATTAVEAPSATITNMNSSTLTVGTVNSSHLNGTYSTVTNSIVENNIIGSASNDYVLYTASVFPKDTNYWDLGSETKKWHDIHVGTVYARRNIIGGTAIQMNTTFGIDFNTPGVSDKMEHSIVPGHFDEIYYTKEINTGLPVGTSIKYSEIMRRETQLINTWNAVDGSIVIPWTTTSQLPGWGFYNSGGTIWVHMEDSGPISRNVPVTLMITI